MSNPSDGPRVSLLVIRARDIDRLAEFYSLLGLNFEKHRHGKGPEHFASESGGLVFEIYPLGKDQQPTTGTRIGFTVSSVDESVEKLVAAGAVSVVSAKDSPWGRRAVIDDPEGHRIEIVEAKA